MRALAAKALIVSLAAASLMALNAGQALANHVSCGAVITKATTLDSDLIDCPGDGIVIGTDDITLDLNGHTVDGAGCQSDSGIKTSHSGVTIKNGVVQDFHQDVAVAGRRNLVRNLTVPGDGSICGYVGIVAVGIESRYEKNTVFGQSFIGIDIGGQGNLIKNNSVSKSVYAIVVRIFQIGTRIEKNSISHSDVGVLLGDTDNVHVEKNSISDTIGGIDLQGTSSNEIVGNFITNPSSTGISLCCAADRNLVAGNSVSGGEKGIAVGASLNTVANNLVTGTTEAGIAVSGFDSPITNNVAVRNGQDGIHVSVFGARAVLEGNVANENGDDGIDVDNPQTTLTGNTANRNFDLGIEAVAGVTDGGGNRAFGNGNPLQCLNVVSS